MKDLATKLDAEFVLGFLTGLMRDMGVEQDDFDANATLEDLGLDSLDVVELAQGVKKKLHVQIAPGDFADAVTLGDAVALVLKKAEI